MKLDWLFIVLAASGCSALLGLADYSDQPDGAGGAPSSGATASVSASAGAATSASSSKASASSSNGSGGVGGAGAVGGMGGAGQSSASSTVATSSSSTGGGPVKLHLFVSQFPYSPTDFKGVAGANQYCATLATAFSPKPAKYGAWISDGKPLACTAGATYYLPNETLVGTCADLLGGTLKHPVDVNEEKTGDSPSYVWTGMNANGPSAFNCLSWMDATMGNTGAIGSTTAVDGAWMGGNVLYCSLIAHLYCIESP